jgi:signal peptidase I
LGGRQSYVLVEGTSMEPTYETGDLVIIREEGHYAVGDIIAYRIDDESTGKKRIIHRIVGVGPDGYVTQGDNRPGRDPWTPSDDDVLGRAVLHVPGAGAAARSISRPPVLALLGAATVMVGGSKRRRRRLPLSPAVEPAPGDATGRASEAAPRLGAPRRAPSRWLRHTEPRWAFIGLCVSVALALPILLGLVSTIRATTSSVRLDQMGEVTDRVNIDYRFVADPSPVYPTGVIGTQSEIGGRVPAAPLYSRLLKQLEVTVAFTASASGADRLESSYQLDVVAAMPEGWSRTVATIEPTKFDQEATQTVVVDVAAVAAEVQQVSDLTGVGGSEYSISIRPQLHVEAEGSGATASDHQAPVVAFLSSGGVIEAQPVSDSSGDQALAREVPVTTRYRLGPVSVQTPTARGLFGGLALVIVAAAAWCASVLFGGVGLGEADRIAARYRAQLVDASVATAPAGPVVVVGGIGELARLAKVDQSVILHEDLGDGGHRYRVFLGNVTYEYETAPEDAAGATTAPAASDPSAS